MNEDVDRAIDDYRRIGGGQCAIDAVVAIRRSFYSEASERLKSAIDCLLPSYPASPAAFDVPLERAHAVLLLYLEERLDEDHDLSDLLVRDTVPPREGSSTP